MKNISVIQKVSKQKTLNHVQFTGDFNNKIDLIFKNNEYLEKNKNKNDESDWDDNKEYYENFLIKLKAERKKSHALLKTNLKVDRKNKSKTINLNELEKTKVKSTISNNNKKSILHSFLRKTLIFSKKNNVINNKLENKIDDLNKKIHKPSLKMVSNVQLFIESPNKNKSKFSNFKIEKTIKSNSPNNKINSLINKVNPFEKDFGILNDNYRLSTFCNMELDEKKREKITKSIFESIIPVKENFISNATKIEFKKNCDNTIDNNFKNIDDENNNNLIEERTIKNDNVFVYKIKDESNKKKKLNICCCIPIKI